VIERRRDLRQQLALFNQPHTGLGSCGLCAAGCSTRTIANPER
jgi:hypothetical protein